MSGWSEEIAESRLDVAALLRAQLDGDRKGIEAILDGAGDPGARVIAEMLLATVVDLAVRLTGAVLGDDRIRALVTAGDSAGILLAEPAIRAAVAANFASVQGHIIDGEIDGE